MPRLVFALAIYFGEVASLWLLSISDASYEGWGSYSAPPFGQAALAVVVLAGVALLLPNSPRTTREFFWWWTYATIYAPTWVVAGWTDFFPPEVETHGIQLVTVGYIVLIGFARVLPDIQSLKCVLNPRQFTFLIAACLASSLAYLLLRQGLPDLGNLALDTAYVRRAAFSSSVSGLVGYVTSWTSLVIVPAAILVGLCYRMTGLVLAAMITGLFIYAWVGSKNTILILLLTVGLHFLVTRRTPPRWVGFPAFLAVLAVLPALIGLVLGWQGLLYAVGRRALLVPSWNMMAHVQWGTSAGLELIGLRSLAESVTGQGRDASKVGSTVVGSMLADGGQLNANSHFLSFPMQWNDVVPVVIVAALTAVCIWVISWLGGGREPGFALPFGCVVTFNLSETYLFTGLVSGGLLLAMLLLLLAPPSAETAVGDEKATRRVGSMALNGRSRLTGKPDFRGG